MWAGKGYLGRNSAGTYSAYKDAYITHIPYPKLPQREITERKNQGSIKRNICSEKRHWRNSKAPKIASKAILNKEQ
jgi:hypothetical protein